MREAIRHRGPDEPGEVPLAGRDRRAAGWFGHRRLKILDRGASAAQPMSSADGSVVLTYNGEVYNFRELRRELDSLGLCATSSGDTEVVLHAYEAWGERFVERLDGMFALAVWDARRERLFLARDRVGKKPLFYAVAPGRVAFASEIKSLAACPWVDTQLDESCLAELLTFGYVSWPRTPLQGVVQVPPASWVAFDGAGPGQPVTYWSPPRPSHGRSDAVIREETARLVEGAVRRRMVADVPIGALLSGGVDSSVVAALMARHSEEPIHTFSIGFPDEPSFDERSAARRMADHIGSRHTEFSVGIDAVALLDRLVWMHDGPFGDSSAIPTYLVCQLAREHVTVVLTGDGGDEVFAGYERFAAARAAQGIPPLLQRVIGSVARRVPEGRGYYALGRRAARFAAAPTAPLSSRYLGWVAVTQPELVRQLVTGPAGEPPERSFRAALSEREGEDELDAILHANFRTYLPDDLAVKLDRMSMAHGLEARCPLLDTALVEHLARLPARSRIGLRSVKPELRAALEPLLPADIWSRRKHGFGVPVGEWLRGSLGEVFSDEVLAADARSAPLLSRPVLDRLWDEHRARRRDHSGTLWTVLTLERWLRSLSAPHARPLASPVADVTIR